MVFNATFNNISVISRRSGLITTGLMGAPISLYTKCISKNNILL
jgi:hypothetical protein